jgi:uncharacterized protein (UPF0548 family)
MTNSTLTPLLEWFPRLRQDRRYLRAWRAARPTYVRGDETTAPGWHHDQHERRLGSDADDRLFERAGDLLKRYQFYPPGLIEHVSDFGLERRRAQIGDLIVQRIHALSLLGVPILDAVTVTQVSAVTDEPDRRGLAYVTTEAHFELGEWRAWVERRADGDVILRMEAVSRPGPRLWALQRPFARALQRRAHQEGLANFARRLRVG